jgi:predicted  nucleic acid-binding Zn-ribbon protein
MTVADTPSPRDEQEAPQPQELMACWRCGTDNPRDKRFCRQCGTRLIDLGRRLSELEGELASARDPLSQMPAQVAQQELETLDALEQRLLGAKEAHEAGDAVRAGELLTEVERAHAELTARVTRLQEVAKAAQQALQARKNVVTIVEEAKSSLSALSLVSTSALEKAIHRLETRIASGTRALEQDKFKQALTIFGGASAEKEAKAVKDRLDTAQSQQNDLESQAEELAGNVTDLRARLDDVKQQLGDEVESTTFERRLARIDDSLTQSEEMLTAGNLRRARQLTQSAETKLDALDQLRLARARERETRQAYRSRLSKESAALREKLGGLRESLEGLHHLDTSRQLKALAGLERRLAAAESAQPHKAEKQLNSVRRGEQGLRQQLPELGHTDGRIGELLDRVAVLHSQYEQLKQHLSELEGPEWEVETQSVQQTLVRLADVRHKDRFSSTRPLEAFLRNVRDPQALQQGIAARLQSEHDVSERLGRMQTKADAILQDLKDAQREGLSLREEREALGQFTALLGRVEELRLQGKRQEAVNALEKTNEEQLDQLRNSIEDRLSSSKLAQSKTTLSVTRMPETGGVTSYNVILNVSGAGWQDASSIQGSIKVAHNDRTDLRQAIDDLTTVINVLFGAQSTLRGTRPELPEHEAVDSLSELGDLMYRLFLPTAIQRHLSHTDSPILLASNDLELPWELMYAENEFLCLRVPVGRMPMMRDFPRRNDYTREDKPRFLLIGNPTGDLPATEEEIKRIARRLSKERAEVEVWLRDEVTGLKLHRALASGRYDVIHYSGHAYFNHENPDESGLLLAGQNVFIAQTIQRTLRGRPLILLNACESGREMMQDGEVSYTASETEGLASSFIRGGALAILGSFWPIFDEGAAEFASAFYDGLLSGENLGEVARLARLQLRESRPHDVTWASFVLYGDPTLTLLE